MLSIVESLKDISYQFLKNIDRIASFAMAQIFFLNQLEGVEMLKKNYSNFSLSLISEAFKFISVNHKLEEPLLREFLADDNDILEDLNRQDIYDYYYNPY